uniref:Uncharacterized protein n=1 Tax=Entomoneis paludosa TaxID=265537 RepID=A0A7S2YR84_9STRA|mmetsp:Transcript_6553/g.13691  ORF Transcript_6553/g.13691 Transcript_6553/m.13691 type:complete len:613 (+) Transcript_6553:72-1910(+)|eukprot:CAMPEP_0172472296 /NCGR_PEP_ID=MMETSP1065-20121228/68256_1 /TAXON_ID=265537 /ORGANISM="Amphiprora paludosa, Strain CCMP125" /LENGTH=612 /DNA_ID=CAMNT_0013230427 /DNA_START=62 /DNA_END=1900 /DNA_ORIENTATION=-
MANNTSVDSATAAMTRNQPQGRLPGFFSSLSNMTSPIPFPEHPNMERDATGAWTCRQILFPVQDPDASNTKITKVNLLAVPEKQEVAFPRQLYPAGDRDNENALIRDLQTAFWEQGYCELSTQERTGQTAGRSSTLRLRLRCANHTKKRGKCPFQFTVFWHLQRREWFYAAPTAQKNKLKHAASCVPFWHGNNNGPMPSLPVLPPQQHPVMPGMVSLAPVFPTATGSNHWVAPKREDSFLSQAQQRDSLVMAQQRGTPTTETNKDDPELQFKNPKQPAVVAISEAFTRSTPQTPIPSLSINTDRSEIHPPMVQSTNNTHNLPAVARSSPVVVSSVQERMEKTPKMPSSTISLTSAAAAATAAQQQANPQGMALASEASGVTGKQMGGPSSEMEKPVDAMAKSASQDRITLASVVEKNREAAALLAQQQTPPPLTMKRIFSDDFSIYLQHQEHVQQALLEDAQASSSMLSSNPLELPPFASNDSSSTRVVDTMLTGMDTCLENDLTTRHNAASELRGNETNGEGFRHNEPLVGSSHHNMASWTREPARVKTSHSNTMMEDNASSSSSLSSMEMTLTETAALMNENVSTARVPTPPPPEMISWEFDFPFSAPSA